ncbi:MAG TPA: SMP-30/gluconolactonase/LRE family protein [Steroidobacteraceae bacterium]|nr:SMP-30/gluconolactonase/LRE family protein [Steroidobacteraceae bacterium]
MSVARRQVMRLAASCAAIAVLIGPLSHAASVKVLNDDAHFPEGPVWYAGKLYYVEYDRNTVTVWDGRSNTIFWMQKGCGPSAVLATTRGEFLTTCYDNGTIGRIDPDGKTLPPYSHDKDGHSFAGPNDFAPDARGGVYFTTSSGGKVFYIAPDGTILQSATGLTGANGAAVSKGGALLYVVETDAHRLMQFDIRADASLANPRVFVDLGELTHHVAPIYPDGVKIDSRGEIYIGQNPRDVHAPLAGTIFVVDAASRLLRTVVVPSPGVPNLAFSPDEKTLYVTALDQLDKSPYRGKVYAVPNK